VKQVARKWDAKRSFEECVSDWSVLKLKILLPNNSSLNSSEDRKVQKAKIDTKIEKLLETMQDGLFYELGVVAPKVSLGIDNCLKEGEFRIQLNDLRFPPILGLEQGYFLVNDTVERLSLIKITGKPFVNPANESESAIVQNEKSSREVCEEAGLTTWGPEEFIILALSATFRRNAAAFLTTETVKRSIDQLRGAVPALIDTALEHYSIAELTGVMRDLVEEEFSIRNLRGILETLVKAHALMHRQFFNLDGTINDQFKNRVDRCEVPQFDRSKEVELLRTAFKRYISMKYAAYSNNLLAFLLDPEIERRILNSEKQPLKPGSEDYRMLIEAFFDNLSNVPLASRKAIVLTSTEIRKRLRNLIEKEFPRLAVLCYQELGPDLNIQPISRISLPRNLSGGIP
jgi:type III secretion protein V